ncbi:MAG: hypothetical protein HYS40_08440 [Gemmatimonadetes bacterium]|nr:hypothetical protein [Gemmatimonadota bacterium]
MSYDPPSPLAIVRGFFGVAVAVAALAAVVGFIRTGQLNWKVVALALLLWTFWGFAATLYDGVVAPLGAFLNRMLFFGSSITIEDEIRYLEQELQRPDLEPRHEILSAIRLAEIYRTRFCDKPRADALLDRLLVKYPDSQELQVARRQLT